MAGDVTDMCVCSLCTCECMCEIAPGMCVCVLDLYSVNFLLSYVPLCFVNFHLST